MQSNTLVFHLSIWDVLSKIIAIFMGFVLWIITITIFSTTSFLIFQTGNIGLIGLDLMLIIFGMVVYLAVPTPVHIYRFYFFLKSKITLTDTTLEAEGFFTMGPSFSHSRYEEKIDLNDITSIVGEKYTVIGNTKLRGKNYKETKERGFKIRFLDSQEKEVLTLDSTYEAFGSGQLKHFFKHLQEHYPHIHFEGYSFFGKNILDTPEHIR